MKALLLLLAIMATSMAQAEQVKITLGELNWPLDEPAASFNFDGTTAPALDIHATITDLDLLVSSTGNWRGLLGASINQLLLPDSGIKSIMHTTSPPGGMAQIISSDFSYGNIHFKQRPGVVVGPKKLMKSLCNGGATFCDERPFLRDYGSVLVTSIGNTSVKSIWDLAKPGICFATSGELTEPGSYGRYKRTLFAMAKLERGEEAAQELVDTVYASDRGGRIMHRDVVTELLRDDNCAALLFYHIYMQAEADLPGRLQAFILGGAVDYINPAVGNIRGTQYRVKIVPNYDFGNVDIYDWIRSYRRLITQLHNADEFIEMLDSDEFTNMMPGYWVERP